MSKKLGCVLDLLRLNQTFPGTGLYYDSHLFPDPVTYKNSARCEDAQDQGVTGPSS